MILRHFQHFHSAFFDNCIPCKRDRQFVVFHSSASCLFLCIDRIKISCYNIHVITIDSYNANQREAPDPQNLRCFFFYSVHSTKYTFCMVDFSQQLCYTIRILKVSKSLKNSLSAFYNGHSRRQAVFFY